MFVNLLLEEDSLMTCGFMFSVQGKNVDRVIRGFLPPSFQGAVRDLWRQSIDHCKRTGSLSYTAVGNTYHVRFDAPDRDKYVMIVALELVQSVATNDELRSSFGMATGCGGENCRILDRRTPATIQMVRA